LRATPQVRVTRVELQQAIGRMQGRRILALADLVADEFVHGRVERISREAPVLILAYKGADLRPGGGANAVYNMRTLGGRPLPFGVVGDDDPGRRLRGLLREAGVSVSHVLTEPAFPTPLKTRVLGGGTHSTEQQVVRLDRVIRLPPKSAARQKLITALDDYRSRVDGVLVTDYGIGLITPRLVRTAVRLARRRGVPVTVDSGYGSATTGAASRPPGASCWSGSEPAPCWSPVGATGCRCSRPESRRSTSGSTAPTRSRTSPAPVTP
jgi:rfaE bifunctional protein kinase chain/domain